MPSPVYVALDTTDVHHAVTLAHAVRPHVGGIKLGLEFFMAHGRRGVEQLCDIGMPVFLDLKFHDIPNTVAQAIRALRPLEPSILTIHAAGGRAMMEAAREAASPATKVVAVTVLTSLDGDDLQSIGVPSAPAQQVARLAALTQSAGVDGIVCSGNEVATAYQHWPNGYFVVPGVRPQGSDTGDQKRVMTPAAAIQAGASILVIGRPITQAEDPASAAAAITASL